MGDELFKPVDFVMMYLLDTNVISDLRKARIGNGSNFHFTRAMTSVLSQKLTTEFRLGNADSSTHHPQTEERLGPLFAQNDSSNDDHEL